MLSQQKTSKKGIFEVTIFFQKVFWVFDFGHFFLSVFEKPKLFLKKTPIFRPL
jgi:hypothetical protein